MLKSLLKKIDTLEIQTSSGIKCKSFIAYYTAMIAPLNELYQDDLIDYLVLTVILWILMDLWYYT